MGNITNILSAFVSNVQPSQITSFIDYRDNPFKTKVEGKITLVVENDYTTLDNIVETITVGNLYVHLRAASHNNFHMLVTRR